MHLNMVDVSDQWYIRKRQSEKNVVTQVCPTCSTIQPHFSQLSVNLAFENQSKQQKYVPVHPSMWDMVSLNVLSFPFLHVVQPPGHL